MTAAAARVTATRTQLAVGLLLVVGLPAIFIAWPDTLWLVVILAHLGFLIIASWRVLILATPRQPAILISELLQWPRYTVVAALYDEAAILPQLVARLSLLDYPDSRLEGFLVLEAGDKSTITAAKSLDLPPWLKILIVPPGSPQTKPRALNYALSVATGDLITIYDAEDAPDPQQLKEAAARFATEGDDLVCVQAPLRIRLRNRGDTTSPFIDAQFAAEYAALFEVTLPAMERLGLPFPLGGTSNHFRVSELRRLGGWDPWNVTEDADLGFRIWREGGRLGNISSPTYETPPGDLSLWLPQRTRWIKGYLQTFLVHTRRSEGMGWRGWTALTFTIIAGLLSAAVHAACLAWIATVTLMSVVAGSVPPLPVVGMMVLFIGTLTALLTTALGARRAGMTYRIRDMVAAPFYWCLLSLAFSHAVVRLILEPHRWDKTPHRPDKQQVPIPRVAAKAGREAA